LNYTSYFKSLASGAPDTLDENSTHALYAALFDGGLPELEVGALIAHSHARAPSLQETLGVQQALVERVTQMKLPRRDLRPMLIPTYSATTTFPNLTTLLALLLQRFEIPVLLHGTLEGHGGVATAYVLREFDIFPSASPMHAQASLEKTSLAFVPTAVLSPGLANLLAMRNRLGLTNHDFFPLTMLDPFAAQSVFLANVGDAAAMDVYREALRVIGCRALFFCGTEGEPFANPTRRPTLEFISNGDCSVLFDQEHHHSVANLHLPGHIDLHSTVTWTKQALAGKIALPHPILNQLACCLFASGYTNDIYQAKAIAAMTAGGRVAA
jgi:anthranilate phosphoribosyltransferase